MNGKTITRHRPAGTLALPPPAPPTTDNKADAATDAAPAPDRVDDKAGNTGAPQDDGLSAREKDDATRQRSAVRIAHLAKSYTIGRDEAEIVKHVRDYVGSGSDRLTRAKALLKELDGLGVRYAGLYAAIDDPKLRGELGTLTRDATTAKQRTDADDAIAARDAVPVIASRAAFKTAGLPIAKDDFAALSAKRVSPVAENVIAAIEARDHHIDSAAADRAAAVLAQPNASADKRRAAVLVLEKWAAAEAQATTLDSQGANDALKKIDLAISIDAEIDDWNAKVDGWTKRIQGGIIMVGALIITAGAATPGVMAAGTSALTMAGAGILGGTIVAGTIGLAGSLSFQKHTWIPSCVFGHDGYAPSPGLRHEIDAAARALRDDENGLVRTAAERFRLPA